MASGVNEGYSLQLLKGQTYKMPMLFIGLFFCRFYKKYVYVILRTTKLFHPQSVMDRLNLLN